MAWHKRIAASIPVISHLMQVRVAYTTVEYLDNQIVRPRVATFKSLWGQGIFG